MEETHLKPNTNVVEIRPGTAAQTDREREFVDYLLQNLRDFRGDGIEIDTIVMGFVGTQTAKDTKTEADDEFVHVSYFIGENRLPASTLALVSICVQSLAVSPTTSNG